MSLVFMRSSVMRKVIMSLVGGRSLYSGPYALCKKNNYTGASLPPNILEGVNIELMDTDLFLASSAFPHGGANDSSHFCSENPGRVGSRKTQKDHDLDELEEMRYRGDLFYKLDSESREFEEYNFSFRQRKTKKVVTQNRVKSGSVQADKKSAESKENLRHKKNKVVACKHKLISKENDLGHKGSKDILRGAWSSEEETAATKEKSLSFKQITDAYMQPFCLDVFISKSSVRACIVHRVTSKVVVVAHSISKDMKCDLVSTKDFTACAAVGGILAQRAIADDIYTAVYSPRKGEKLEGKLMVVLQSLVDHGLDVKVRLKQRRH